jgi:hypothetical protein
VFQNGNQLLQRPNMIRQASFHRGSYAQCLMDAAEIVIGMVDRNHVTVILEFLREGIREPRKSPHSHSQIQVLPLYKARRDVIAVRIAAQDASARSDT